MQTTAERRGKILVIDDEPALTRSLALLLGRAGYEVSTCNEPVEAMLAITAPELDVVLVDLSMPGITGMDILRAVKARNPDVEVVMMTAHGTVAVALEAVKLGAWDFLTKPFDNLETVVNAIGRAFDRRSLVRRNRELERLVASQSEHSGFVGESPAMREVFSLIERVAYSTATVLVTGESGTGKELVARAIHKKSPRAGKPFIAVNCAAMTETLLESELFGHVKGAFTGAVNGKKGLFEAASGGTLFLDEIGDMPPSTQVHLLRALQEGEVRPLGSTETVAVDVRVIAATNVDVARAIEAGKFREDLYYRLNVIPIALPPLRDRPTDVPLLAYHYLRTFAARLGKPLERFTPGAMQALVANRWAGNVRELENVVERAAVLARGREVTLEDIPRSLSSPRGSSDADLSVLCGMPYSTAKRLAIGAFDRRYLDHVLKASNGSLSRAAALAGLDRSNFRRLLRQCGLSRGEARQEPEAAAPAG